MCVVWGHLHQVLSLPAFPARTANKSQISGQPASAPKLDAELRSLLLHTYSWIKGGKPIPDPRRSSCAILHALLGEHSPVHPYSQPHSIHHPQKPCGVWGAVSPAPSQPPIPKDTASAWNPQEPENFSFFFPSIPLSLSLILNSRLRSA